MEGDPEPVMPTDAWDKFNDYRQTQGNKGPISGGLWKVAALGLLTLLILTNVFWYNYPNPVIELNSLKVDTIYLKEPYVIQSNEKDVNYTSGDTELSEGLTDGKKTNPYSQIEIEGFYDRIRALEKRLQTLTLKLRTEKVAPLSSNLTKTLPKALANGGLPLLPLVDKEKTTEAFDRYICFGPADIQRLKPTEIAFFIRRKPLPFGPNISKKSGFNLMKFLRPKSLSGALSYGLVQATHSTTGNYYGYSWEVGLNTTFSSSWRASLSIASEEIGAIITEKRLPKYLGDVPPPPGYHLDEIEWRTDRLKTSFSIDYLFRNYLKIRPYLGVRYSYVLDRNNEFVFDFEEDLMEEGASILSELEGKHTHYSYLGIQGGLDYNLARSFDLFLGISYDLNISDVHEGYFSFRPGIYYHF